MANLNLKSYLIYKRALDIVLSIVIIILLLPLLAAVATAIRLDSRGPIFFVQKRVGKDGKTFSFYKFRSMVSGAERLKQRLEHLSETEGPIFKIKKDPRITRIGKFIRRYSIDELPQLFNVLKGDMSLVGPRPPLPSEVAKYTPYHKRRLSVRPGITCLWQISGRSNISFYEWVELDIYYIGYRSFLLDLKILMRTIPVVITGRGAY
jgi:exopolysaccharide biosynthesis polyprenyl glycosylphosphotransferase